jgi:hypothetical protein
MKLNHNSISARLYRWFYMKEGMPQNLCPYFWKLVIMWILIIPYGLLSLPVIIGKNEIKEWGVRPLAGAFGWGILFIIFVAIFPITYLFWGWFDSKTLFGSWQLAGIFVWSIILIGSVTWGILEFIKRGVEKKRHIKEEWIYDEYGDYVRNPDYVPFEARPNIIKEFIKAKYNKYCPKIDWE